VVIELDLWPTDFYINGIKPHFVKEPYLQSMTLMRSYQRDCKQMNQVNLALICLYSVFSNVDCYVAVFARCGFKKSFEFG
jgi:hypothetical protein